MHFQGILIGIFSFVVIGLFHPIVIKAEYYFSCRIWPVFLLLGMGFLISALFIENILLSALFSVLGFTCLWSIGELIEQRRRVERGWFPKNPKRKNR